MQTIISSLKKRRVNVPEATALVSPRCLGPPGTNGLAKGEFNSGLNAITWILSRRCDKRGYPSTIDRPPEASSKVSDTRGGTFLMSSSNNSPNTAPPTSSPPPLSPPMVSTKKRVTQTYGSKRIEAPPSDETPDADRSFGTLVDGDISISLSPATRSSGIDVRVVSSQETKVDEDEDDEKDDSHEQTKHKWSWMSALKESSDDEGGSTPALPLAHADGSPSPPASRSRGVKSRGKRPSTSPKKPQRLQLTTVSSDSRTSVTASAEPETGGSDSDRFPSPLKPKQRPSRRTAGTAMVEDSESEVPLASSSKSRGNGLGPVDADANNRAPLDSTKQKRKTTGRKPTAKVDRYDLHSIGFY